MRAGAMEIEYVMKLIIMLVVVASVIALVLLFSGSASTWWCGLIGTCGGQNGGKTEVVKQAVFTASDVAKYTDSCWLRTGPEHSGDFVCYVLQGRFEAKPDSIAPLLRSLPAAKLTVQNDLRGDSAVIQFTDLGDKVTIS